MILISTASAINQSIQTTTAPLNRTPITTALFQTTTAMLIRKKNTKTKQIPIKATIAARDPTTIHAGSPVTITTGPNVQRIDICERKETRATAATTALLLLPAMKPEALLPVMNPSKPI